MRLRLAVAAGLFLAATVLYQRDHRLPLDNGDEAIYAEFAREMAESGDWLTLHWQGRPVFQRPPLSIWPMALAIRLGGASEAVIRAPLAIEAALGVALLFLLGSRRYGVGTGLCAALLLGTSGNWFYFARYIESDPLLTTLVIAAFFCWEEGFVLGWGAMLGLGLMTKQVVGALPLLAPLLAFRTLDRRRVAMALGIAGAVCLPWASYETARFGWPFVDGFLVRNVITRAGHALHSDTTPLYYFQVLWRDEGPLILVAAIGIGHAAWKRDWLPLLWTAGALLPLSLAASRYTYYVLLVYPALMLAIARVCVEVGRRWVAGAVVAVWAALHVAQGLAAPIHIDAQSWRLGRTVAQVSRPDDVLLVIDQLPYAARFYAGRRTIQVVDDPARYRESQLIAPAEIELAADVAQVAQKFPRWFAIAPWQRRSRLSSLGTVYLVDQTPAYVLVSNLRGRQ